ncbi:LysR family transcriptional regulator [Vibrio sp. 10N.286.49.B3]|uniref:LysR family transcriptional regulator n=1 Tax=Vibrio sp. 10N.286.49.B3 TaxID=1880855 RepID=UPI000C839197|nr:LysR family transcriptional regulator [Vibrio sp. 10N.286.49.B3]PMH45335.1 LysR family transcriptional regulator [Vibrio sp. 10N.286.49.B3]
MLNQINLSDIRSFVLIARLGNFTKAAEALNVSRSHVSRQVSSLEKQMGVTLFIRTTRTLRLTHAGQDLYARCEQALNNIDQALIAAVDNVEEVRGDIKVNCVGGYLGEVIIAELVNEFMQLYPDISICLDFSSNRVDLIEGAFDIAFRMGSLEDAGFIARKLLDIEMGTLASPEYFARKGKPNHPKDLIHHDCLTGSVRKWSFQALDDTKKTVDVHVTGRMQCKNGRVLVQGAKSGNGIIRVPTIYCLQELNDGQLLQVFEEWVVPKVDFSAIYHRDRYQPSRIRTFIDFVKDRFEQM